MLKHEKNADATKLNREREKKLLHFFCRLEVLSLFTIFFIY